VCGLQTAFAAALHGATVKFGAQTSTANFTPIGAVSRCWAKNLKIAPLNDRNFPQLALRAVLAVVKTGFSFCLLQKSMIYNSKISVGCLFNSKHRS